MAIRRAAWVPMIGVSAPALALAFLACGAAMASDVERQIPLTRDTAGSGLTLEISREGIRQTATPFLTLNYPTVERIEERVAEKTARLAAKGILFKEPVAGSVPGIGLTGTPRGGSMQPGATLSSLHPVPEEITVRNVKRFLKGLRTSRKGKKPVPAVVTEPPEQRIGIADASLR